MTQITFNLKKYVKYPVLLIIILSVACKTAKQSANKLIMPEDFLDSLFKTNEPLQAFIKNKDSLNIQVIYTKIDRNKGNKPTFTEYRFNVDPSRYFYPASTVKMPLAFLALEKLNELKQFKIDRNTATITEPSINGQAPFYKFDTAGSVAKYVEEIFLVSDNEAYNRLYEFLGQEYIQQKLKDKGYEDVIIRHRLNIGLTDAQNRQTNAINFIDKDSRTLYRQPQQISKAVFKEEEIKLGKGYNSNGKIINNPFSFTVKNRIELADLHTMIQSIIFPGSVNKLSRFVIKEDNRNFLLRAMSALPREGLIHKYIDKEHTDNYVKFLLDGLAKTPAFNNIRCFNKIGLAYGFITDASYFADFENNVEFMLSATILSNKDQIFNDDKYDYETIGFPFMKLLGKAIYDYELKRDKQFTPNLQEFKISYE